MNTFYRNDSHIKLLFTITVDGIFYEILTVLTSPYEALLLFNVEAGIRPSNYFLGFLLFYIHLR